MTNVHIWFDITIYIRIFLLKTPCQDLYVCLIGICLWQTLWWYKSHWRDLVFFPLTYLPDLYSPPSPPHTHQIYIRNKWNPVKIIILLWIIQLERIIFFCLVISNDSPLFTITVVFSPFPPKKPYIFRKWMKQFHKIFLPYFLCEGTKKNWWQMHFQQQKPHTSQNFIHTWIIRSIRWSNVYMSQKYVTLRTSTGFRKTFTICKIVKVSEIL